MYSASDEQEINDMFTKVTGMFENIKQAFVNAREFAAKMETLQQQVNQLTHDFDQLRAHNSALDEALRTAYAQRDAATQQAQEFEQKFNAAEASREQAERNAQYWEGNYNTVNDELSRAKEERSKLTDDLNNANAEITTLREKLGSIQRHYQEVFAPSEVNHTGQPRDPETQQWRGYGTTG